MNCKQINNKLIFFIEKSLPDNEIQEIETHIENCDSCKQLFAILKSSLKVIDEEKKVNTNQFLYTRVMQQIENRKKQSSFAPQLLLKKVLQPAFYGAILVVGIGFGVTLGNMVTNQSNNTLANNDMEEIFFNDFDQEPIETFLLNDNE